MKKQAGNIAFIIKRLVLAGVLVLLCSPCSCAPPKGVYHRVEPGQTLYRIGKVYQVEVDVLARVNHLRDRSSLDVGQRLYIPGATRTMYVPPTVKTAINRSGRPQPAARKAGPPLDTRQQSTKGTQAAGSANRSGALDRAAQGTGTARQHIAAAAAGKGKFSWPVKGSVLKKFGEKNGTVGNGMEIAVPPGSTVRAAAAGKVIYSGDGIKGYGNLIILKHDESFFTVYGFNRRNLVAAGGFVGRGDQIALSGRPPGGGQSRLHFEIRCGKEALNPQKFLP
jgi:lipoprotein NlpD